MNKDKFAEKIHPPLMRKFIFFSIILFFVATLVGSAAFILSMRQIIGENKEIDLSRTLEIERITLETSVNNQILVAMNTANSPLIRKFFLNPGDPVVKPLALDEIRAYGRSIEADTIFWISDIDKMFYSDDEPPFILDTKSKDNYWYEMTLNHTEGYNFNINYNPDLNVTNLWVNVPVFDKPASEEGRTAIGMLGSGINLSTFINTIYKNYTGAADIYLFNSSGEITGAAEIESVVAKKKLWEEFEEAGSEIFAKTAEIQGDKIIILNTRPGKTAICAIPSLEWYAVAILPYGIADYKTPMTALFFVVLIFIAVLIAVFNVFISQLLKPLRRTMESLAIASRAKSEFLSNMSHEIRTPLNAIIGMTAIGMNSSNPARQKHAFEKIEGAGHHLLGIINDILDMSKIEANKMHLSPAPFDFRGMIHRVTDIIDFKTAERKQDFSVEIDPQIPLRLNGDEQRLAQVVTNLLSNAVKFTPEGGRVSLAAALSELRGETALIRIDVADNGIGISPEQQAKLFISFQQAETSTSRKFGGTGLGLAISKSIVQLMGGQIWIESELGAGAKFSFTFEAVICHGAEDESESAGSGGAAEPDDFSGYTVLLAEDIEINREIVISLLQPTGISIVCAGNGDDAVRIFSRSMDGFDIIFMDMQMPVMDGIEATRRIRALDSDKAKQIPIVAMTANVFREDVENCIAAGMNDHVGKPINIGEVCVKLRKFLRKR
jgi:signal transduction histidine kinase